MREERSRWFVGREADLALLDSVLDDPSCSLLYVTGQAGVGKTGLLLEFARRCQRQSRPVGYVDAAEVIEHSASELQHSYARQAAALGESARVNLVAARPVLLLDSYERLAAFEPWLLGQFALGLPSNVLLVFASRQLPSPRLNLDSSWTGMTRCWQLEPLLDGDARKFLGLRDVPPTVQDEILGLVGGYPLGLTIAAETLKKTVASSFTPQHSSDVWQELTQVLELRAASHAQQLALDVCALAQTTTCELLEHVLAADPSLTRNDAPALLEWLATRPFIQRSATGLRPHRLARVALAGRAKRDNPRGYPAVYRPVREFFVNELAGRGRRKSSLNDLFYLDRDLPFIEQFSAREGDRASSSFETANGADQASIVELIRELEGDESALLAQATFRIAPHAFELVRNDMLGGNPEAICHCTRLTGTANIQLAESDPVARLVARFIAENPLVNGEQATLFRWFLNREDYQKPTARVLNVVARQSHLVMSGPPLAYSLCVYRNPQAYSALWDAANTHHQVVGTFDVGEHEYSLVAFPFRERSLRDQLIDPWRVPQIVVQEPSLREDQKTKIQQRIATLGKSTKLTEREAQILELLCLGGNYDDIGLRLGISPRTVKFHQENVLRKTGSSSRVELFRKLI